MMSCCVVFDVSVILFALYLFLSDFCWNKKSNFTKFKLKLIIEVIFFVIIISYYN